MTIPTATHEPHAAALVSVDGRRFPLAAAALAARAAGGFALSTLTQGFENPYAEPLEVLYTLPLPADGAVLGYTVTIGERVIRAEVQPRETAERAYREALYAGRTAGLLEQSRIDTFQQRLGNVPPGTRVEITIDVLHPLAFVGDGRARIARDRESGCGSPSLVAPPADWEYRFPTVVGVRYTGAPGRVTDAEALAPDRGAGASIPLRMTFTLELADANAHAVACASHACDVTASDAGTRLAFRAGERLDRDVVVRWSTCAAEVGVSVVEGAGLAGDDGRYALVTIVPPPAWETPWARDLTVLLDASGSMSGEPLEVARAIVRALLESLGAGDRFELLAFAREPRSLTGGWCAWSESALARALAALERVQAGGGTEMESALASALASERMDAQRQVVLVTDGQIGFEAEVVARVTAHANVRLHVAGVGAAPNRALTQQAAAAGRGVEVLAVDVRDVAAAARRLVAATARPVLTGITVRGSALAGDAPQMLRDVCAGQPLAFTIELADAGGTLDLRGDLAGTNAPWTQAIRVPARGAADGLAQVALPVGALCGRERIAALELAQASAWGEESFAARIEALGMRHRIASSRTSLVAIAEEPSVDPTQPRRRERLAVELPHGVSAEGVGFPDGATARCSIAPARAGYSGLPDGMMEEMRSRHFEAMRPMFKSAPSGVGAPSRPGIGRARRRKRATAQATVILRESWLLSLEVEVPENDWCLPTGEVALVASSGLRVTGSIVVQRGSGEGPFAAGLCVKLVVVLDGPWPACGGEQVTLNWDGGVIEFTLIP